MHKISRPQYGLQEEIMETIFKLISKKSSQIFRQPVDGKIFTDYYQKIKNPMDLQTILNKLKKGQYKRAKQVYDDLQLIITNCNKYNQFSPIIKKGQQFQASIKTQWNNLQKQLKKKNIQYNEELINSQEIKQRLILLEQKRKKKKTPTLQMNLIDNNRKSLPDPNFLSPISIQPLWEDKNQIKNQLPLHLQYKQQKYIGLVLDQKKKKFTVQLGQYQDVQKQFDIVSQRKLKKYQKIILKKIMWIQNKIIQKCLQKKRFKKMQIPNHLSSLIESGEIATKLQIRKLQMYIKQVVYWIQQYAHILSDYMKDKFVQTCRSIRKCLSRVLRYKKIPKATKIQLQSLLSQGQHDDLNSVGIQSKQNQNDDQFKNYQSKMKQFRRMLIRDRGQSTKRDTKIILKNDGSQLVVVDWNSQNAQKRNRKRQWSGGLKYSDIGGQLQQTKTNLQKKQQIKKDQQFIEQYKKRSNLQILLKYQQKLIIQWDHILFKKYQCQQLVIKFKDNDKQTEKQYLNQSIDQLELYF